MRYEEIDPSELESMETLSQGQAHDLKLETDEGLRYWLSRCGAEDGQDFAVDIEELIDGRWEVVHRYGAL